MKFSKITFRFLNISQTTILLLISCGSEDTDSAIETIDSVIPQAQRTFIPDPTFEAALIELNLDNELDGTVLSDNIDEVMDLILNKKRNI